MKVAGEAISVHLHIMILLVGSFEELDQEMTFGISRDNDKTKFLSYYVKHGVLGEGPVRDGGRWRAATPNADTG
ncbi:hypothetical protein PF007_g10522 [Phytophthora fragariae]|uniref:Uncharacterized protein n=1 Tax=Phytophthora fragariae TaxID=53985 RepID=A0A6A3SEJ2_9STRA|nr:hypothetical protein PF007_g10522 [Phytophthora fragariae]